MIVNSRSFSWKPPHLKVGEMVMCPFIDLMNHGSTGSGCKVTQNAKGYEVHADRDYGKHRFSYSSLDFIAIICVPNNMNAPRSQ